MERKTQQNRKKAHGPEWISWRGLVAAALVVAGAAVVLAWPEDSPPPADTISSAPKTAAPPVPQPPPTLHRGDLIDAAARAASAFAAGRPTAEDLTSITGRRFRLALPFGCGSPDEGEGELANGWRFDADSGTLRVVVTPALFGAQPETPAREGFWIAMPWLRDPVCPALPAAPDQGDPDTLAIVRLMDDNAPRRGREAGEPYRLSVRINPAAAPGAQGLRLVIEGRFEAGSAAPVACAAPSAQTRPTCIFAARFDRLAITDHTGLVTHGEWVE